MDQVDTKTSFIEAIKKPFKKLINSIKSTISNRILEELEKQLKEVLKDAIKKILEGCGEMLANLQNLNVDDIDKVLENFDLKDFLAAVKEKLEGVVNNLKELPSAITELTTLDAFGCLVAEFCVKCVELLAAKDEKNEEEPESIVDIISEKLADYITEQIVELIREIIGEDKKSDSDKENCEEESGAEQEKAKINEEKKKDVQKKRNENDEEIEGDQNEVKEDEVESGEDTEENKENAGRKKDHIEVRQKNEENREKVGKKEGNDKKTGVSELIRKLGCSSQNDDNEFLINLTKELKPALKNKIQQILENRHFFMAQINKKMLMATIEEVGKKSFAKKFTESVSSIVAGGEDLEVSSVVENILKMKLLEDFIDTLLEELKTQDSSKKNEKMTGQVCKNLTEYIADLTVRTAAKNY